MASENGGGAGVIRIPYGGPNGQTQMVSIPTDRLPEDPEKVLRVLRGSVGPLRLWLDVAVSAGLACRGAVKHKPLPTCAFRPR